MSFFLTLPSVALSPHMQAAWQPLQILLASYISKILEVACSLLDTSTPAMFYMKATRYNSAEHPQLEMRLVFLVILTTLEEEQALVLFLT